MQSSQVSVRAQYGASRSSGEGPPVVLVADQPPVEECTDRSIGLQVGGDKGHRLARRVQGGTEFAAERIPAARRSAPAGTPRRAVTGPAPGSVASSPMPCSLSP